LPTPAPELVRVTPAPLAAAARTRLSAASSVNNRARSVKSVFVIVVDPGSGTGGGDFPLVLDNGGIVVGAGDPLHFLSLATAPAAIADDCALDAGIPKRVLVPEDAVELVLLPPLMPEAPPLRKLPGVVKEDGEGV